MAGRDHEKQVAARASLRWVEPGMVVGLGTGSTAAHVVRLLGERVREGLPIRAVATSEATRVLAAQAGIPLVALDEVDAVDVTIDGADEIGPDLALIKGGGAALLHEKIVWSASRRCVVIADAGKLVERLGAFPLAVEVIRLGWRHAARRLEAMGARVARRERDGLAHETEEGNWILDCRFDAIADPAALARAIDGVTGVVEHGLFVGMASVAVVGVGDDARVIERTVPA
jgi:ribose 5-phosphate isomerase A